MTPLSHSLFVYPNPAKQYIVVSGLTANSKITIIISDNLGKVVATYHISNAMQYRCDISRLTTGVYHVQVTSADKKETLKFVKE